jgi:diaminopimelate decarboxylase
MTGPVPGFHTHEGELWCEGVAVRAIAASTGTPVHLISAETLRDRYRRFDAAFAAYPHRAHYAIKANATLAVVRLMRELGAAADANSGGEIEVALRAGFAPHDIVFTGVGKTHDELARAVALGLGAINAESFGEIDRIDALARAAGTRARIAIRINPDVDAESHPHISTGHHATKFGVTVAEARAMLADISRRPALAVVGLHVHVGSQITSTAPLTRAAREIASLARDLAAHGVTLEHLDVGGGLGVAYRPEDRTLAVDDYAAALLREIQPTGLTLVLEPGRWLVAPAGALIATVVDLKPRPDEGTFVIVDAGMTDLLRPALYGAWHAIEAVHPRPGTPLRADIVGPVCETTDTLGQGRQLPPVDVGDLIAVRDTGAYGSVMASNYNRRPLAAEVMVDGDRWTVVRRRQTVDDMLMWDA